MAAENNPLSDFKNLGTDVESIFIKLVLYSHLNDFENQSNDLTLNNIPNEPLANSVIIFVAINNELHLYQFSKDLNLTKEMFTEQTPLKYKYSDITLDTKHDITISTADITLSSYLIKNNDDLKNLHDFVKTLTPITKHDFQYIQEKFGIDETYRNIFNSKKVNYSDLYKINNKISIEHMISFMLLYRAMTKNDVRNITQNSYGLINNDLGYDITMQMKTQPQPIKTNDLYVLRSNVLYIYIRWEPISEEDESTPPLFILPNYDQIFNIKSTQLLSFIETCMISTFDIFENKLKDYILDNEIEQITQITTRKKSKQGIGNLFGINGLTLKHVLKFYSFWKLNEYKTNPKFYSLMRICFALENNK